MTSAAAASYRSAAELGDPDDGPLPFDAPRCSRCGGFLSHQPAVQDFDKDRDEFYEGRQCRRCGTWQYEWVY